MPLLVRDELPQDYEAIREVNRLAFAGNVEAALVDRLRSDGLVVASLVAVEGDQIAGHILFSELPIQTEGGIIPAASLAPVAVLPGYQRRGIGSQLIREGLGVCRTRGKHAVLVLGHPDYYPRFGFSPELARQVQSPFTGEAWMAVELIPGSLAGVRGTVSYPDAFQLAD